MSSRAAKPTPKEPALTEINVRPEQARYLASLNAEAQAVAAAANEKFQIALSAVLMGQVPDGSEIVKIDAEKGVLYVKEGVASS